MLNEFESASYFILKYYKTVAIACFSLTKLSLIFCNQLSVALLTSKKHRLQIGEIQ